MDLEIFRDCEYVTTLTDVSEDPTRLADRLGDICTSVGYDVSGALEREGLQEAADELLEKGKTTIGDLELKAEEFISKLGRMPWRRMPGRMPWRRMPGSPKSLVRELLPKVSVQHDAASGCLRRIVVQNVPRQLLGKEIAKQFVKQHAITQTMGPKIATRMALPGIGIPLAAVAFGVQLLVAAATEKFGKSGSPTDTCQEL